MEVSFDPEADAMRMATVAAEFIPSAPRRKRLHICQTAIATVCVFRVTTLEISGDAEEPNDEEVIAIMDQQSCSWTIDTPDEDVWNIEDIRTEIEFIDEGQDDAIVWCSAGRESNQ